MCTITIIPLPGGLRVACNRDEQRTRQAAFPPRVYRCGDRLAVFPIDPVGGGTWIATNDAGLVMVLLNRNPLRPLQTDGPVKPRCRDGKTSRGAIIPSLLHCDSSAAAMELARNLHADEFQPFRLIAADAYAWGQVVFDGRVLHAEWAPLGAAPLLFTSSGLGDELVEGTRQTLFRDLFGSCAEPCNATELQDAFHRHQWHDQPHLSVRMSRADARTVSQVVVTARSEWITLEYQPLDEGNSTTIALEPRAAGGRHAAWNEPGELVARSSFEDSSDFGELSRAVAVARSQ